MDEVRYMISEASKRVEVEDHVLRYWEQKLVLPIGRNEMGHRYYKETDINLLKTIKNLKDQGFQLKAVKMLLPNLHLLEAMDNQTIIRLKGELNKKVKDMEEEDKVMHEERTSIEVAGTGEATTKDEEVVTVALEDDNKSETIIDTDLTKDETEEGTSLVTSESDKELKEQSIDKVSQFKAMMNHIITTALKENNTALSEEISGNVTDSVIKEMSFLMRVQEEKEEERFRKFDLTLRDYQRSRMMTAATINGRKKNKSKFRKKNRVYI